MKFPILSLFGFVRRREPIKFSRRDPKSWLSVPPVLLEEEGSLVTLFWFTKVLDIPERDENSLDLELISILDAKDFLLTEFSRESLESTDGCFWGFFISACFSEFKLAVELFRDMLLNLWPRGNMSGFSTSLLIFFPMVSFNPLLCEALLYGLNIT